MISLWTKKWTRRDFLAGAPSGHQHFEPEAPALQGRCSTRLSYRPIMNIMKEVLCRYKLKYYFYFFVKKIKKEVIQPQVPLRLPCDDLTLLTELRFETVIKDCTSSKPCSSGLTGGVCKEQGRIHRTLITSDY